ncbi:hypothetical protein TWF718_008498 [Orbilia javanica]|uniref:Uncharacterized protein n=1 Tax=Orbilia javanica TaxID=47235 RepID=A0AAN8N164_9PEZI
MNQEAVPKVNINLAPIDANSWTVDNWQVPVPLGDCSVHLLLCNGRIRRAFIMDGGKKADQVDPKSAILDTLELIDDKYGKYWSLNKWVVTHWDEDHYQGVLDLLLSDEKNLTRKHHEDVGSKVKKSFRTAYFGKNPRLYSGADYNLGVKKSGKKDIPPLVEKMSKLVPEYFDDTKYKFGESLIGLDLFTGRSCFKGGVKPDLDFSSVEEALEFKDAPHFTVLGASGYAVGPKSKILGPFQENPKEISKNETSILSLLHWGKESAYFTGGDGNPRAELEAIMPFLEKYKMLPVNTYKLDHHGSSKENIYQTAASNPEIELIRRLQAPNLLVTPGNQYGHPTFDLVTLLSQCTYGNGTRPVLYTTRLPYWMSKAPTGKDINLDHLKALEKVHLAAADRSSKNNALATALNLQAAVRHVILQGDQEYRDAHEAFKHSLQTFQNAPNLPSWEETSAEYRRLATAYKKALREYYARNDPHEEEPERPHIFDAKDTVQEDREMVKFTTMRFWRTINKQASNVHQQSYSIIRFKFDRTAKAQIVSMDRQGYTQELVNPESPEEDFDSQDEDSEESSDDETPYLQYLEFQEELRAYLKDQTESQIHQEELLENNSKNGLDQSNGSMDLSDEIIEIGSPNRSNNSINLFDFGHSDKKNLSQTSNTSGDQSYDLDTSIDLPGEDYHAFRYVDALASTVAFKLAKGEEYTLRVDYKQLEDEMIPDLVKLSGEIGQNLCMRMLLEGVHDHLRLNDFRMKGETPEKLRPLPEDAKEVDYDKWAENDVQKHGDHEGSKPIKPKKSVTNVLKQQDGNVTKKKP